MEYLDKAIDYAQESNVDMYLFRAYINSVDALLKMNHMKEAQQRLNVVNDIAERTGNIIFKARYSHIMGQVYFKQANYQ